MPLDLLKPLASVHTADTQSSKILGPGINFKGHILLCNKPVSEAYFTLKKDLCAHRAATDRQQRMCCLAVDCDERRPLLVLQEHLSVY